MSSVGHTTRVYGAFKLPLPPGAIVDLPPEKTLPKNEGSCNNDMEVPVAVMKATLAVFELDNMNRIVIPLRLPIYAESALNAGDEVEAYFDVDLYQILGNRLSKESCIIYLIIGEYIDGPRSLTITVPRGKADSG